MSCLRHEASGYVERGGPIGGFVCKECAEGVVRATGGVGA